MKRKAYLIVRVHLQHEFEIELDDETPFDAKKLQEIAEGKVEKVFGSLKTDIDEPDEVEVLECDWSD